MFGRPIRLGRLFGTAVYLDPLWFLILILYVLPHLLTGDMLAASVLLLFILGVYGSVLLHEYAHIFTAKAFGIRTPRVIMHLFGGAAQLAKMPWGLPEAIIAIAGPIFSAVFGLLLIQFPDPLCQGVGQINFLLALFNLLPIPPLDGGRVVRGIAYAITGKLVASTKAVTYFGLFVVLPLAFAFAIPVTIWTVVLAILIIMMSLGEMKHIEATYSDNRSVE